MINISRIVLAALITAVSLFQPYASRSHFQLITMSGSLTATTVCLVEQNLIYAMYLCLIKQNNLMGTYGYFFSHMHHVLISNS